MELRTLLGWFLAGVLYPIWLVAGAGDYLCHRFTRIERTSGSKESWFHIAQFLTIAVIFVSAVLLEITLAVLVIMAIALIAHTALSLADVAYTSNRRHISTLEQHVHGFMDVIPFIAVCLLALMHWDALGLAASTPALRLKGESLPALQASLLLGSFAVLAGVPVFEEWFRTHRAQASERTRDGSAYRYMVMK
jgi:hypothetical protein